MPVRGDYRKRTNKLIILLFLSYYLQVIYCKCNQSNRRNWPRDYHPLVQVNVGGDYHQSGMDLLGDYHP